MTITREIELPYHHYTRHFLSTKCGESVMEASRVPHWELTLTVRYLKQVPELGILFRRVE